MDTLEDFIQKYNFSPQLIFNFDETALDFSTLKLKVISNTGSAHLFVNMAKKSKHISLSLCVSASS
jgi:hypothetical protein